MTRLEPQPATATDWSRNTVYGLLIAVAVGSMTAHILAVQAKTGNTPMLSANDRSRWITVRALVDHGTYEIDEVIKDRDWRTIDMVRHRGHDGRRHYYSSKPPLLATLLAGQYWLVKNVLDITLADKSFYIIRLLLIVNNVLPMLLFLMLVVVWVERLGTSPWGRLYVVAAASFGTFLTTFAVTLNNHLPAAVSVMLATHGLLNLWTRPAARWFDALLVGLAAAFAAANELPALSFLGLAGLVVAWKSVRQLLLGFLPGVAVVTAAFFGTNYLAHQSWRPPYAHRDDGAVLAEWPAEAISAPATGRISRPLRERLAAADIDVSTETRIEASQGGQRWIVEDPDNGMNYALRQGPQGWQLHAWDNWYDYPKSYWRPENKRGVDKGEASSATYALHVLIGHHGIFSLTPIWLLSIAGCCLRLVDRRSPLWLLAVMTVILTVVCLAFYLTRPLADRNYGGVTSGFRWMFWFTPLWLLTMLPAVDWLSRRRWGRALALVLLAASVLSARYATPNPWSHPWPFAYQQYLEE